MKRKILLFSALASLLSLSLFSFKEGEFTSLSGGGGVQNRTGSATPAGFGTADCSSGSGCHATNTNDFNLNFTLTDMSYGGSGRLSTGWYIPGHKYMVSIKGAYASDPTPVRPAFGFQCAAVGWKNGSNMLSGVLPAIALGSPASLAYNSFTPHLASPVQVDTFTAGGAYCIENVNTLSKKMAGSSIRSSYEADFYWTAPDSSICDTVGFWYILCAVDSDGTSANDATVRGPVTGVQFHRGNAPDAVSTVFNNASFASYPNPVKSQLFINMSNLQAGAYGVNVFDMSGKKIFSENLNVTGGTYNGSINAANWANGIYQVQFTKDGAQHTISIVKQ